MSGGSQHNPNGRQSQLGSGWSPLQLQVANFLARAPQAHMASERGVTWHTPTPPPPHLYHVPAPSPPDPLQALLQLQAMKAGGNSVFRHTATPPEMYRHTPTPPDKHLMRHTPSPGDVKLTSSAALPPAELYPHLGPGRDKLRPEDLLAYACGGVDLSLAGARGANGAPPSHPHPSPALSVRDAPTINSLIARAQPRHPHARVDALLERLVPSPVSPHSVIMHSRAQPTPSPPSSNEDSADSCGAPPGAKRKRKPERTIRLPSAPAPPSDPPRVPPPLPTPDATPLENGDTHDKRNGPEQQEKQVEPIPELAPDITTEAKPPTPQPPEPHARRKTRSGSSETIDEIAAMIASTDRSEEIMKPAAEAEEPEAPVTIDKLKSVLASPEPKLHAAEDVHKSPPKVQVEEKENEKEKEVPTESPPPNPPIVETAAAPKRRSARTSNSESTNVPVESPSEAKPAEAEASEPRTTEPTAASFVEVENQLEKMFAGIEETPKEEKEDKTKAKKRRKSAPTKGESKAGRRSVRASTGDERRKGRKKGGKVKKIKESGVKDAYDSGSNASSGRSRGPYIQIRGPRDSPLSVSVINAPTGEEEGDPAVAARRKGGEEFRNGLRARGLHASTLGLRYDATTPDASWLCAFCERGPHAAALGDLFGPYTVDTDCEEYRSLDEATRQRYSTSPSPNEVWFHEACGVWAPGLVAAGARLWGLARAVWAARAETCDACARAGAALACAHRACRARAHLPCAAPARWRLSEDDFRALCPRHAPA